MGGIRESAVIPVEGTLLSLAVILVSIRLVLRLVLQRTRLTLSDWMLVASIVDAICLFTTDTMAYKLGGMDADYDTSAWSIADQVSLMKVSFAGNYFYDTGVYFPKLALIAFYHRLVPPTMPRLRKWLHAVTVLTVCFAVATCFVDTFWCGANVPVNWDLNGSCDTFDSQTVTRIDWSMNIAADFMIFSIPFPLLRGLKVNRKYMIGLIVTFSSGIITLAASISRFVTVNAIFAWTNVYVLSMTEMVAAIIVVCLPALKSFLGRIEASSQRRGGTTTNTSDAGYAANSSHFKLSSGRDPYSTSTRVAAANGEDSGSEVELNSVHQTGVIYKSARISVTYQRRDDMI